MSNSELARVVGRKINISIASMGGIYIMAIVNYMTLKKKILNRRRVIFADWMPITKTAKIVDRGENPVYSICDFDK